MHRPNILIFMPDQMHRETVGSDGSCRTPNFNMLASQGVEFTSAFTATPICTPARASMYTGLLPHQHQLLHNSHMIYPKQENLPEGLSTFADELGRAGYATYHVGKWHVGSSNGPGDHGFKEVESLNAPMTCEDRFVTESVIIPNRCDKKNVLAVMTSQPRDETQPWRVCQSAAEFIRHHTRETPDQPFLAFASTDVPHVPWYTPETYVNRYNAEALKPWPNYGDDLQDKPTSYLKHYNGCDYCRIPGDWPLAARALTHYYGMITLIDEAFGLILEAIEESGQLENTLIVVTSDHGEFMGRHGLFGKNEMLSEDLIRIPLIASWPVRFRGGCRRAEMVTLCDLYPTLLDAAGLSGDESRAGRSLLPLFGDEPAASDWPRDVYLEHHGDLQYNLVRAVRDKRFKYVYWANDLDELYDLQEDPWEKRNLIFDERHAARLEALRARLLELMAGTDDPFLRGARTNLQNSVL